MEVGEVREEGKLIVTEVVVSGEGDLLVDHVQTIVDVHLLSQLLGEEVEPLNLNTLILIRKLT